MTQILYQTKKNCLVVRMCHIFVFNFCLWHVKVRSNVIFFIYIFEIMNFVTYRSPRVNILSHRGNKFNLKKTGKKFSYREKVMNYQCTCDSWIFSLFLRISSLPFILLINFKVFYIIHANIKKFLKHILHNGV